MTMIDKTLSVQDVHNAFTEHMEKLDEIWPDHEGFGPPRKVHLVELIDGIKLKLYQLAEKNATMHESAFMRSARKITGYNAQQKAAEKDDAKIPGIPPKSDMQLAYEDLRARIKR